MIIQVKGTILSPLEMQKVLSTLKNGGILVYPTETAYGIGCNAYNAKAIKEIYEIKKRPKNQPLAVIVSSLAMAKQIGVLPSEALTLSKVFHPGPLTIAVP
ncbi:MAG: Sua5/YciO/YrdC/YwlC family protein, partial [Asgard group archaeon]|nr:Sua5/YciO/YrdC/YwlC family protein [Asgard group archaeon]